MHSQRGLTMGEILFVVALLIVGLAMLTYVWLHTGVVSRHRACATNVRQLGTAMMMYAMDHDDAFPAYGNIAKLSGTGQEPHVPPQPSLLRACLRLYTDDPSWFCPSDSVQGKRTIYLGIDHEITSYAIPALRNSKGNPARVAEIPASSGIVFDAAGDRNSCEPGIWLGGSSSWASNHPDGYVNYVFADLSLHRGLAMQRDGTILP